MRILGGSEAVPALVAVHRGVHHLPVDASALRVDRVDHRPPGVDVFSVPGQQDRVSETRQAELVLVAVGHFPGRGVEDGEPPAVDAAVPLASRPAADHPVEPDVGGDDPAVELHPVDPGVDVVDEPVLVFGLMGERVGVEGERSRLEVDRVVADDVVVFLEVLQHLLVVLFAVEGAEAVLDLDRVAGPIQGGGLPQQRSAAAVEQAADDLVLPVVVLGAGILVEIEAGVAANAGLKRPVVRDPTVPGGRRRSVPRRCAASRT